MLPIAETAPSVSTCEIRNTARQNWLWRRDWVDSLFNYGRCIWYYPVFQRVGMLLYHFNWASCYSNPIRLAMSQGWWWFSRVTPPNVGEDWDGGGEMLVGDNQAIHDGALSLRIRTQPKRQCQRKKEERSEISGRKFIAPIRWLVEEKQTPEINVIYLFTTSNWWIEIAPLEVVEDVEIFSFL